MKAQPGKHMLWGFYLEHKPLIFPQEITMYFISTLVLIFKTKRS